MRTFTVCPVANTLLTGDPTITNITTTPPSTQSSAYFVMQEELIEVQPSMPIQLAVASLFAELHCRASAPAAGGAGGGAVRWYVVADGKEVGAGALVTSDYKPITDEITVGLTEANHAVSGYVDPPADADALPFRLVLAAKVDDVLDTIYTWWRTETELKISYSQEP